MQNVGIRAVHVDVHVLAEHVENFLDACRENAAASMLEPGVLRFDVLQDRDDPAHVVLVEVYADADAPAAHKATHHYATWRDTVAPMMARPRGATHFTPVAPLEAAGWASG